MIVIAAENLSGLKAQGRRLTAVNARPLTQDDSRQVGNVPWRQPTRAGNLTLRQASPTTRGLGFLTDQVAVLQRRATGQAWLRTNAPGSAPDGAHR